MKSSLLTNKLIFPLLPVWVPNLNESFPIRVCGIPMFLCSLMNCVIMVWVSPADAIYAFQQLYTPSSFHNKSVHERKLLPVWLHGLNESFPVIPTFLCSLMYCVIKFWVSPTDTKYVSMAIHSINFPQLISSQGKPEFAPSTLITFDWNNVNLLFKTAVQK